MYDKEGVEMPNYGANAAKRASVGPPKPTALQRVGLDELDSLINTLASSAYQLETKVDRLRACLAMTPVYDVPQAREDAEECSQHRIHNMILSLCSLGARIDRASANFDTLIEVIS